MNNSLNQMISEKDFVALDETLNHLSGFEIASIIENKSLDDQVFVFSILSPNKGAETFDYLPIKTQKTLLHNLPTRQVASILRELPPDDRTAMLEELPRVIIDEYVKLLPEQERILTLTLLGYPENSVGRLMTTDYIAVKLNWTVREVLDHIKSYGHDSETISYIYVVDDYDTLIDDINIRYFLFFPDHYMVSQLSDGKFLFLSVYDKVDKAIIEFKKYGRTALPVIDENRHILGIVTIDDILRVSSEITTEKIQNIGGLEALDEPYMQTAFTDLIKKRGKWLVMLFLGELLTATAMGHFEDEISKAVVLAMFLPLIISSGGNAGSQSTTLIIRAMALGEVKLRDWWRIMKRELAVGVLLGAILGSIGFARVTIWSSISNMYGVHWLLIAITIFFSLIGVVLWGNFAGSMLPFILRRIGTDPATSSAPLVATIVDVVGIIIYFTVAIVVLNGTLL